MQRLPSLTSIKAKFNKVLNKCIKQKTKQDIPFKDLTKSAILSKIAYFSPDTLNTIDTTLPTMAEVLSRFQDYKYYDANSNTENKQDTQAYLWYDQSDETIYIAFRGTSSNKDALADLNVFRHYLPHKVKVHDGFYEQYIAIEQAIFDDIKAIEAKNPVRRIVCCGHSLAGAISHLAVINLYKITNAKVYCHTFGSPRVGNKRFAQYVKEKVHEYYRIFNERDFVSMIPMSFRFHHVPSTSICIKDSLDYKTFKQDISWVLRPFVFLFAIIKQLLLKHYGFLNPIEQHNLDLYITHLHKLSEQNEIKH